MEPRIVREKISREELTRLLEEGFVTMVKVVVDIEQGILAAGGELHADAMEILLNEAGSKQENLWGANFYPNNIPEKRIEYTSLINIRPKQGNRGMEIKNPETRSRVRAVIEKLFLEDNG